MFYLSQKWGKTVVFSSTLDVKKGHDIFETSTMIKILFWICQINLTWESFSFLTQILTGEIASLFPACLHFILQRCLITALFTLAQYCQEKQLVPISCFLLDVCAFPLGWFPILYQSFTDIRLVSRLEVRKFGFTCSLALYPNSF